MSDNQSHADHSHHDKIFVVTFLGVLAILVGITVVIAAIANVIDGDGGGLEPIELKQLQQRLQPVGEVYTDANQIVAVAAPAAAEPRSADEVVSGVCAACHASGVLAATTFSDAAGWQARLDAAGGLDGLTQSAIAGKGNMPPRGGDASLSDEDVKKAVAAMLKKAGL